MWSGAITKNFDRKKSEAEEAEEEDEEEEEEEGGEVAGLHMPNDKPLGNIGEGGDGASEAAALLLGANLPHSSIYKHQLPQKSGCLLSIKRNHSPMAHLIMRPHTEPGLDAASPLFGPASFNPLVPDSPPHQPPPPPAHRLRADGGRCVVRGSRPSGSDRSAE